jgi:hypothetical protein
MSDRALRSFQYKVGSWFLLVFEMLVSLRAGIGIVADTEGRAGWFRMWLIFSLGSELTFQVGRIVAREPFRWRNLALIP